MNRTRISPSNSRGDIELMEGGTTTGDDREKAFQDFRADVKRRIDKYNDSKG
jgi:hypothetical protein